MKSRQGLEEDVAIACLEPILTYLVNSSPSWRSHAMALRWMTLAACLVPLAAVLFPDALRAETYYVARQGVDTSDGRSQATPWQTIARVNDADLKPGDRVLFRRGDSWREQLVPRSGSPTGPITYGAYGSGSKPLLVGSVAKNRREDWRDEGGDIWATVSPEPGTGHRLPGFAGGVVHWSVYCEGGAQCKASRDTADFDSAPDSYSVGCHRPGHTGSDVQLFTARIPVRRGTTCLLTFRAKCSMAMNLAAPVLMKAGPPWTNYAEDTHPRRYAIGPQWITCTQYYHCTRTAADGRLTFFLGDTLPKEAVLHVDSVQLAMLDSAEPLVCDVGNLIFDDEKSCGVKVWKPADLKRQGQYWYDEQNCAVKLYSARCPAEYYHNIECALRRHQIYQNNTSYVIYENLALKYGAAHGIGGANTHHIIVRDCDFGFIGGGDQMGGGKRVRFGNGVEFWGNAHDNLVERCRLWEIYDAALTNQNHGSGVRQENITYRNNLIWNCEYSFEYWNRPTSSRTRNIYFENNTCLDAGHCWGHGQRPDPSGRHLCFYHSDAPAENIVIRNNIFDEATGNAFFAPNYDKQAIAALRLDHNCWFQSQGTMVLLKSDRYGLEHFSQYQSDTGLDLHSLAARPGLVDPANGDFHLAPGSPCIDAGADTGLKADFEGTPVPQRSAPDIGAYEFHGR